MDLNKTPIDGQYDFIHNITKVREQVSIGTSRLKTELSEALLTHEQENDFDYG